MDEKPIPRIEDYVLMFHVGCIGVITGPLTHMVCAECGAVMDGMTGSKPRPVLVPKKEAE